MNPKLTDEMKILISSYVDNEATEEERQQAEDLLIANHDARQYYIELTQLSSVLNTWENEDSSADLDRKLARRIKEHTMNTKPKYFLTGAASAFVVLVAVVVVGNMYKGTMSEIKKDGVWNVPFQETAQNRPLGVTNQYAAYYQFTDEVNANKPNEAWLQKKEASKDDRSHFAKTSTERGSATGKTELMNSQIIAADKIARKENPSSTQVSASADGYRFMAGAQSFSATPNQEMAESAPMFEAKFKNVNSSNSPSRGRQNLYSDQYRGDTDRTVFCQISPCPQPPVIVNNLNTEQYDRIVENQFLDTTENPLSTFSIDVDTSSYSNVRRFLNQNQMPPADSVRIEEMVNYFSYEYPEPKGDHPFSITTKASVAPWNHDHRLVMIGLQGKRLQTKEIPPSNLVFLIDVSGSMNQPNKLPLLKEAFKMMVNNLTSKERVAIVTYAGSAGLVLESTPGNQKMAIYSAIDRLQSGGSTAGGAGIQLAYKVALENFIEGGNNRVILATDGDFNVGTSSDGELVQLIEKERDNNVFLTILGFGTGNYKDAKMEKIANNGNGTYHYIDTDREAKKVLVSELGSTLFTIAKDVKLQIEFNPMQAKAYRLIGYENRMLAKEDFNNDAKDAGELGAGHTVTAFYEVIPADTEETFSGTVDALKYQAKKLIRSDDLMTVKLRYKDPDKNTSKLIEQTVKANEIMSNASDDFQFAGAVAEFGLILRDSEFKGTANYTHVLQAAQKAQGTDTFGYRQEFIELVRKAQMLDQRTPTIPGAMQFK